MELLSPRIISETKEQIFISRTSHPHISLSFPRCQMCPLPFSSRFRLLVFFRLLQLRGKRGNLWSVPGNNNRVSLSLFPPTFRRKLQLPKSFSFSSFPLPSFLASAAESAELSIFAYKVRAASLSVRGEGGVRRISLGGGAAPGRFGVGGRRRKERPLMPDEILYRAWGGEGKERKKMLVGG